MAESGPAEELQPLRLRRLRGDGFFEVPAADRVSGAPGGAGRGSRRPQGLGLEWVQGPVRGRLPRAACGACGAGGSRARGLLGEPGPGLEEPPLPQTPLRAVLPKRPFGP